jgi:CTP:molybdopterin cytidylyltransferase MocA
MARPKALLEAGGETFAARLVRVFNEVTPNVVLVTGAIGGLSVPGARAVLNPDWRLGQLTSLQRGLSELAPGTPAAFFTPVDCPLFEPGTVRRLWERFQVDHPTLVIPQFGEKRGHPVLVSADLFPEFLALPRSGQARTVIHAHRPETVYVDVADEGVCADIDTPEDYERWVKSRASEKPASEKLK